MKRHAAPILVAFALLLPVQYLGSYLVLVVPEGIPYVYDRDGWRTYSTQSFRYGGRVTEYVYRPLSELDRKVRPRAWFRLELDRYERIIQNGHAPKKKSS